MNNKNEIPVNQTMKDKKGVEPLIPAVREKSKVSDKYKTRIPPSEIVADWIMPCEGKISNGFGYRKAPIKGASKNHSGIDIAV